MTGLHLPRISESVSFIALKDSESSRALKGILMSDSEIESQKKEEKENASTRRPHRKREPGFYGYLDFSFSDFGLCFGAELIAG